jgi:20S proteasome alpha/beta subunit
VIDRKPLNAETKMTRNRLPKQKLWGLSILVFFCSLCTRADTKKAIQNGVFRGTVNVIVANGNGLVAATDSRASQDLGGGRYLVAKEEYQKLFVLDDKTVCTISGFGYDKLPNFPNFISSAAGIIDRYKLRVEQSNDHLSFHEKLVVLQGFFHYFLTGLVNLQPVTPNKRGDYEFHLLLAGYDNDGSLKIGKFVLIATESEGHLSVEPSEPESERVVGPDFTYEPEGAGRFVVKAVLDAPDNFADELAIEPYATAKKRGQASALTTDQMEKLAAALVQHSAKVFPSVIGGRVQLATLKNGKVDHTDLGTFRERPVVPYTLRILDEVRMNSGKCNKCRFFIGSPDVIYVVINSTLSGGGQPLDNTYWYNDKLINMTLSYNGGMLGFDNNDLVDCTLVLGVSRQSPGVAQLLKYKWKEIKGE